MKSALEVLRKYRNKNSNLIDDYYKKKKLGIKIENYSSLFYVMEDETSKAYLNPHPRSGRYRWAGSGHSTPGPPAAEGWPAPSP